MKIVKKPDIRVFASGAKTGEILAFPDILRGWGVTLDQTQGKPPIEWMNDAFNRIDLNNLYLLQQGIPEWDSAIRYPVNSIIKHDGKIYLCAEENDNNEPNANSEKWSLYVRNASEKDVGILKVATQAEVNAGANDTNAITPKKLKGLLDKTIIKSAITVGYDPLFQYETGDIVKEKGIYYECYHPQGCKGIDPTDAKNRPSGWVNQDVHAPYSWVAIGKYLMLPEVGSPQPLATMQHREGLIKYRNDTKLSAAKYWRIAEQNPNLVKDGFIEIAELRGNVIRALDDGHGIDVGRVINSYQEDAMQKITGDIGVVMGSLSEGAVITGAFYANYQAASPGDTGAYVKSFDSSRVARSNARNETVMKNIAMLMCCRI